MRIVPAVALLAAAASGCAAADPEPRGSWGGIVEERPEPPPPLAGRLSVPTPSVSPYPAREFSPEEQEFFGRAWSAFKQGDLAWPQMREQWKELGPEAVGLLAENLYRAMVASRARGALHLVEVAKKELVVMGDGAVPVLVGGLAVRAVRTESGGEVRVGQEILHDAAEALSLVGEPAVPGLLDLAASGEPSLVTEASWALGNIVDPRAEETLVRLAGDPNAYIRASAVLALRRYPTDAARAAMVACLEDGDSLVVERAAQALATGRQAGAVPGIVEVLERGVRDTRILTVRACVFALRNITGQSFGEDPAAWRGWMERK